MGRLTLLVLGLVASLILLAPVVVSAQAFNPFEEVCTGNSTSPACPSGTTNPISGTNGVILRIVRILSFVIGVVSVIIVILGGLKYITSNGDPTSITNAKNTILYALIGLAVAAFAQIIVAFIISRI